MDTRRKVVIVTQYDLPDWKRNMNQYQRAYHGSRSCDIALLVRSHSEISDEMRKCVRVVEVPGRQATTFMTFAARRLVQLRAEGYDMVLTDPSVTSMLGYFAKRVAGYFWVLDIWDPPRRRLDATGNRLDATVSDRLVLSVMNRADFVVFSGMKEQAPQIRTRKDNWMEFLNAIDLRDITQALPVRRDDDPNLHLAIARSVLHEESGVREIVEATERLNRERCPVTIHFVGKLTPATEQVIRSSTCIERLKCHGFIPSSRSDFFRNMHGGLVPYRATEDLSYIYPIKVMEHLSQGNPVIASRLPGLTRMVKHEQNGLLFDAGDVGGLAAAIARLQSDRMLWRRLAKGAMESARQYDAAEKNRQIFRVLVDKLEASTRGAGKRKSQSA